MNGNETDLKKSVESHLKSIETNHEIYVEFKLFDGNQKGSDSKPNIISQELHKYSNNTLNKLVAEFKYNNREFRGRGRPSIWTPYRSEDNESKSDFNVDKRRNNAKRKAIKTKMNTESVSVPHILWTEWFSSMNRIFWSNLYIFPLFSLFNVINFNIIL